MTRPGRVLFRVDASPTMGAGHVVRTRALADRLAEDGCECVFAMRADGLATARPGVHRVVTLDGAIESEPRELNDAFADGADWLVVDHYQRGADFERACRAFCGRVLAIDDLPGRAHDADLLVDQTPGRVAAAYAPLLPHGATALCGPFFALLRPQFARRRQQALQRRVGRSTARRVLVGFGATDVLGLTAPALAAVGASGIVVEVDVVLGTTAPGLAAARRVAAGSALAVRVHEQVEDMASLLAAADIAIGAAGSSALERCCLGLPSLLVVCADNQRDIADGLAAQGAACIVDCLDEHGCEDAIGKAFTALAGDKDRLRAMSAAAASLCDGDGARRVAALMRAMA